MADPATTFQAGPGGAVGRYKSILRRVLEARPSGTRQRIARALGKNRSFVSQITNPSYATPIPARHVELILDLCHLSRADRSEFLDAYTEAHPDRLSGDELQPRMRAHTVLLPHLGDTDRNRKVDIFLNELALKLADLLSGANEGIAGTGNGREIRDEKTDQQRG